MSRGMQWPQKDTNHYLAQVGLSDNDYVIKGLVQFCDI